MLFCLGFRSVFHRRIFFEFKFNGDKDQALNQIKDKKYFEKYQGAEKEIYLFGVEFADRNVGEWVMSPIAKQQRTPNN